jgi:hypothetical protein
MATALGLGAKSRVLLLATEADLAD